MAKQVFEILREVSKKANKADKVAVLKANDNWALKDVIRGSMDSTVKWLLPEGAPPYTPSEEHNHPTSLLRENRKFAYFARGGKGGDIPAFKRERMFIEMLEGVHPEDALLLIDMISKKKPKGLSRPVVEEAFPGLLRD